MKEYRPTRETSGVLKRWLAEIKRFQGLWIEMAFYISPRLFGKKKSVQEACFASFFHLLAPL